MSWAAHRVFTAWLGWGVASGGAQCFERVVQLDPDSPNLTIGVRERDAHVPEQHVHLGRGAHEQEVGASGLGRVRFWLGASAAYAHGEDDGDAVAP